MTILMIKCDENRDEGDGDGDEEAPITAHLLFTPLLHCRKGSARKRVLNFVGLWAQDGAI